MDQDTFDTVPFRIHPRVFAALGENLVTDDFVAVIELVKNSYDAFARHVSLRFSEDSIDGKQLEIIDDGLGMTREVIEEAWCTVATPYKDRNPTIRRADKIRRVVGEKGLGRLSAARLGNQLRMLTKADSSPCWEVNVDWTTVSSGEALSDSVVKIREFSRPPPFEGTGTSLLISGLSNQWDDERVRELGEDLARLISPFSEFSEFRIFLRGFDDDDTGEIEISSPEFLTYPKYSIGGTVDAHGNVEGVYRFAPIAKNGIAREVQVNRSWETIWGDINDKNLQSRFSIEGTRCGPFSFELRAWDIASSDTGEISEAFDIQRSFIRDAIRAHKGISIYRDGVLVLPKSENTRDWLGLDLRRISRTGTRLSTSQIVGYVSISADGNPNINDTSDREGLTSCVELSEFETIILTLVELFEVERSMDRSQGFHEKPMEDLLSNISADSLIEQVDSLAEEGAKASDVVPLLHRHSDSLVSTRKTLETRFLYYSRLATIGTIAQMLVHEIRNRTMVFGSFLKFVRRIPPLFMEKEGSDLIRLAQMAVDSLEDLADRFAPLASRSFRRTNRRSILEDRIRDCVAMLGKDIQSLGIQTSLPDTRTVVAVAPGELDAIVLNLITNATYWLGEVPREQRKLKFVVESQGDGNWVRLWVNDSGSGIDEEDAERVFWPGVTRKPGGIGMGLTVAAELVEAYGGKMFLYHPGKCGGASFGFDLPILKQN
ncbi:MAG: ATP-binding protein [Caldilineaceae bacterium]|nr:ATP-binding protein [Caldilineaceae bacterium]